MRCEPVQKTILNPKVKFADFIDRFHRIPRCYFVKYILNYYYNSQLLFCIIDLFKEFSISENWNQFNVREKRKLVKDVVKFESMNFFSV